MWERSVIGGRNVTPFLKWFCTTEGPQRRKFKTDFKPRLYQPGHIRMLPNKEAAENPVAMYVDAGRPSSAAMSSTWEKVFSAIPSNTLRGGRRKTSISPMPQSSDVDMAVCIALVEGAARESAIAKSHKLP